MRVDGRARGILEFGELKNLGKGNIYFLEAK
jgi:hypothetical protein